MKHLRIDSGSNKKTAIRYLLCVWVSLLFMQACVASPPVEMEPPPHHVEGVFQNYPLVENSAKLGFGFYWKRFTSSFKSIAIPDDHQLSTKESLAQYERLKDENTVTWIGQSTLLIKINGITILTDPFFAQYASPIGIGPRRFVNPGIPAEALPEIDILLISHNHYDHLDEALIDMLPDKQAIQVMVPLKLGDLFEQRGYRHIHELDWNESVSIGGMVFSALPAVHYSGRGLTDKNSTLWCSWAISTPVGQYYFIGDSAYSPSLFKEVGEKFSPFDLAMITIGTYGNRKYGVNNHMTPEEAVMVGREINAKALMGIHWGTIDLSDEAPWEPPKRFRDAATKADYSSDAAWLLKIGETRKLPQR